MSTLTPSRLFKINDTLKTQMNNYIIDEYVINSVTSGIK